MPRLWAGPAVFLLAVVFGLGASSDEFEAALDSFTGEWKGEIRVHALDGYLLKTFPAERTYSWEDGNQIAETRFSDGSQDVVFRDVRSVQRGRLHLRVERPGMPEEEFGGELGEGGIIWTNVQRNNRDLKERILMSGETPAIEASSVEVMRVTGVSGLVRVSMHFESTDGHVLAGTGGGAEISLLQKRIEDLENQLAAAGSADPTVVSEREAADDRAADLAARVADLEAEKAKIVAELVSSTAEAGRFNERVDELTVVIREAKEANEAANRQIGELDRTLLETRNEIESLRTEALEIIDERDALAAELEAARVDVALAMQQGSTTRDLERRLETLEADRDEHMARAADLAEQLSAEKADTEKLRSGADAGSIEVEQLRRELAASREEIESRDADLSRTRAQLAAVEKERGELAAAAVAIQELTAGRDRAKTESSDLSRKLKVVEAELAALRSSADSESARAEQLQAQLAAMTAGLETQTNEVARLNERLLEAQSANQEAATLAAERDALRSRVKDLEVELADASRSAASTGAEQEALAARLVLLESRADISSEALDLERRENQRRYELAEGGRLEAIGRMTEVEAELKPLREELALRDRQLAEFKQTLASLEGTSGALADVRAKVRELEEAREAERVKNAAERDDSRAQIVALKQNVDELKSATTELGSLESLAEQRQKDNENLVRRIDMLTTERGQLMARISVLETEIAQAPSPGATSPSVEASPSVFAQGDDLATRVERLDRRVIELESERNSLRNREEILEAQLKEASDLRDGTLARFQDVVSQLNAIRVERDRLARANVSLESDLRAAQSQRTLAKSDPATETEEGGFLSRIISLGSGDPEGSSREIDRVVASYEIIGVTASEAGDKAILNGRVYHGGDVVDVNLGIVFRRIDGDALVFVDDSGREYRRRF